MLPPTPTQLYLVWIIFRRKISFVTSFAISMWLKKYYTLKMKQYTVFNVNPIKTYLTIYIYTYIFMFIYVQYILYNIYFLGHHREIKLVNLRMILVRMYFLASDLVQWIKKLKWGNQDWIRNVIWDLRINSAKFFKNFQLDFLMFS